MYVDGIGSAHSGIYTSATGPTAANAGSDITYVVSYKNGGTATAAATLLKMVIPTGTTYRSNNLPSACTGVTTGGTGTLTCSLGALAAGASGSLTVTVNLNAGTSGTTVSNGNYSIEATGISALLGPKVLTSVTSGVTYADIAITKTDGAAAVGWGQAVRYTVQASNAGPGAATSVTIADTMPAQLTGVTWTCAGTGGGSCSTASGSGNLSGTVSLPASAAATYTIQGTIIAGTGTGSIVNTATATVGGTAVDPDSTNNSAVDTDSIGVLRTLSISKTNSNGGTVTSVPASIACDTSCSSASGLFVEGTSVVLSASPVSGASFTGWGGACTGSTSTCALTISGNQSVTAAFTPPPTVNLTTGNNQGAALGTAFATALKVRVLDSSNNPISGATVLFTAPASGASATLSSTSVTTDASGFATITATANNTAGAYGVVAAISGTPTTGSFSLWNYGAAASISVGAGSAQSATVATAFATPLKAVVRDAAGQPVPNVSVTWSSATSGARATLSPATATTTDANGETSVAATAGTVAGAHAVTASVAAIATPASFALTNTAGAAASLAITSGSGQTTLILTAFGSQLTVIVRDSFSNPVPSAVVTFSAPATGASASLPTASGTTNAAGQVAISATANGTIGTYIVSAAVSGAGAISPVGFSLANSGTLVLIPATATVAPRSSRAFGATGDPVNSYSYAFVTNASGGTIVPTTGAYQAGGIPSVSDVVRVTDSLGRTANATITVGPGVAVTPSPATVAPRGMVTFTAMGGSGTGFSYALTTNPSGGTVGASTGVYAAGATGNVSDVVTVTDSLGNATVVTVAVSAGVALSPATPSTTPRGTVHFVASGGSGLGFVYAVTTNRSGATLDAAGNYTAGDTGNVADVVTVTDSLGNTASRSVTVGPGVTLSAGTTATAPRGALTFTASGGTGTGYVFSFGTNASGGTLVAASGAYRAGIADSVTDTIVVVDSLGNSASANIAVGPGVSITPPSPAVAPRGRVNLVASGGSGSGFSFTVVTNVSGGSVNTSTGVYTAGARGSSVDTVRATDSLGNTGTVAISVGNGLTINPPDPLLAPRQSQLFGATGGSATGYAFALTSNGSGGTIDPTTGAYVAGISGNTSDVVTVTDSLGNTATATVAIGPDLTVTPAAPSLAPLGAQTFAVSGGSGTGYRFVLSTNASGGNIEPTTGAYVAGAIGGVTDVVLARDSLGNARSVSVTVTAALQIASAPVISASPRGSLALATTGGAGGNTFALTTNGSGATLDAATGAYVAGTTGNTSDLVTVTDANGASVTIRVNVGPGITLAPGSASAPPRGQLTFTATGGSGLGYRFTLTSAPSGGTIDATTGLYNAGAVPSSVDVVGVVDSLGNVASVAISVGGGLALNPAAPQVAPRATVAFAAVGGSGSGLTFALTANLSGGSIVESTGIYTAGGTPNVVDRITVTDSVGNMASASVTVGAGILVAPASSHVAPGATVVLSASGGSGMGYLFAFANAGNNSGATLDATMGRYVAGGTPSVTDTVTVTDSLGNQASATIDVGSGLSLVASSTSMSMSGPIQVPPRGTLALIASGGSGGYAFAVRSNGSGGSIVSTTGVYTAGTVANTTDVVEVVDDVGNRATFQITIGDGVSILPASPAVAPGGGVPFTALGGSGTGYVFTLTTNGSGATVDPQSGRYVAGDTDATTDVVTVTDSLGNSSSVSIAVGDRVALNPPTAAVAPRATVRFTASGGGGTGYTFTILTNGSGASVDADTGVYTAGATPGVTDLVGVVDSLGKTATAVVMVGAGVSITPDTAAVTPKGTIGFAASGGSGSGYRFAVTTNGSAGTIDPARGDYQAGAIADSTDVVTVTDSLGNSAVATITIGGALSMAPADRLVPPRGAAQLSATRGALPYVFAVSVNHSGASVDPATGAYVAGSTPSVVDTVTVTDANGASASATIHVGVGIAVSPSDPKVTLGGTVALAATGGSGSGFVWRIVDNGAGGSIDPSTGVYTASRDPASAGTSDVVEVMDSLGNVKRVTIQPTAPKVVTVSASGGAAGCACDTVDAPTPAAGLSMIVLVVAAWLGFAPPRRRRSVGSASRRTR